MSFLSALRFYKRNENQSIDFDINSSATIPKHITACPICDAKVQLPDVFPGQSVSCPRCGALLLRVERDSYLLPIVYTLTALVILLIVSLSFFMGMTLPTVQTNLSLSDILIRLIHRDFLFLAYLFFTFVFATPIAFLMLHLYIYSALIQQKKRFLLRTATRWLFQIKLWLMVDIFAVSSLVALVKIRAIAQVEFGVAFFALFAYSLLLARILLATHKHWIYSQLAKIYHQNNVFNENPRHDEIYCANCGFRQPEIQKHCHVCKYRLQRRKSESLKRTWAFLITAIILYIPANLLPMMISSNPVSSVSNQILDGVYYLWLTGDRAIAVIIFIASVAVPLLKIVSMLILLLCSSFKPLFFAKTSTHIYHMVELIGRWSMIDVFVIMILMSVFSTNIARVNPGVAVVYFSWVVLFTMFATLSFDIRLIWDKAGHNGTSS